jgi:hypothetical protein
MEEESQETGQARAVRRYRSGSLAWEVVNPKTARAMPTITAKIIAAKITFIWGLLI